MSGCPGFSGPNLIARFYVVLVVAGAIWLICAALMRKVCCFLLKLKPEGNQGMRKLLLARGFTTS
jgi:hypothetical protein